MLIDVARFAPATSVELKEARARMLFTDPSSQGFGPYIMGQVFHLGEVSLLDREALLIEQLRYCFGLLMMGILLGQWWQWVSWNRKERTFVRCIVVSQNFTSLSIGCKKGSLRRSHDADENPSVCGGDDVSCFERACFGMVSAPLCGFLCHICPICRNYLYVTCRRRNLVFECR